MAARVFHLLPARPYRIGMAATTHTVTNQVPPLVGHDVFAADRALSEAVERHIAPGVLPVALCRPG